VTIAQFAPYHHPVEQPPPPATWWDYFNHHRDLPMAPQVYDWTCSICAATWVLQATGLSPDQAREETAIQLGANCVNPDVGLTSTECLVNLFSDFGVEAAQAWVDWAWALEICAQTTGVLNSTDWYHFVAIRGVRGDQLWIANSAPGYRGIWDTISRAQFEAWAGSWQAVWLKP
jgi:hypothetical protein